MVKVVVLGLFNEGSNAGPAAFKVPALAVALDVSQSEMLHQNRRSASKWETVCALGFEFSTASSALCALAFLAG